MRSRFKEGVEMISMAVELDRAELLWAARLGGMEFADDDVEDLTTRMFHEPQLARLIKHYARQGLLGSLHAARNRAKDQAEKEEKRQRFEAMTQQKGGMLN